MMTSKRDYYEILGISKTASPEEIKKAYRKFAHTYHPDRAEDVPDAEDLFKEGTEAYSVLSDPDKRKRYDQYGHEGVDGVDFSNFGFGDFPDIFSDLGDIFGEFFGGGRSRRSRGGARRGADLRYDLELTLEEAVQGTTKKIEVPRHETCTDCHGTGAAAGTQPKVCSQCQGTGQVGYRHGFITHVQTCHQCKGAGTWIETPCKTCKGQGRVSAKRSIDLNIPAGTATGLRLKVPGQGESGLGGGPTGDLYVVLIVKDHPLFYREGDNLACEIPVTFVQAALGADIEVPTLLEGNTRMRIPQGTQTGALFTLRSKGVPNLRGYGRGDQIVRVVVEVPTKLTARQKELLKEFEAETKGTQQPLVTGFWDKVKDLFTPSSS